MEPKATTTKRKTIDEGGSSPKRLAGDSIDSGGEQQDTNLATLPSDILLRIFPLLEGLDRYSLSVTCSRLYEVEKDVTMKRTRSVYEHLAVQTTGIRVPELEIFLHRGVRCEVHEGSEEAKCSLRSVSLRDGGYWKVDMNEALDILRSIVVSSTVKTACLEIDLEDGQQRKMMDSLQNLRVDSVFLLHGTKKSVVTRHVAFTEKEEVAKLPSRIWRNLPFFKFTTRFLLKGYYVTDWSALYTAVKASPITEFSIIFSQEKNATPHFTAFFEEAMPWAKDQRGATANIWSGHYRRGIDDGIWRVSVVGEKTTSVTRRIKITCD